MAQPLDKAQFDALMARAGLDLTEAEKEGIRAASAHSQHRAGPAVNVKVFGPEILTRRARLKYGCKLSWRRSGRAYWVLTLP